jgi:hypothetical protein
MRHRLRSITLAFALAAFAVACEGRTSGFLTTGPIGEARVRLLNAVASSLSVDFLVDGRVVAPAIPLGGASPYVPLTIGSHQLQVRSTTTGTILVDFLRDLSSGGAFSFVPAPGLSQFGALVFVDDPTPRAGLARLRIIHASAALGPVSIFVTAPVADLSLLAPTVVLLDLGFASDYLSVAPGTYRVRVTRAGDPGVVLLDTGGIPLGDGTVRTVLLTDAPGGGPLGALSIVADAP